MWSYKWWSGRNFERDFFRYVLCSLGMFIQFWLILQDLMDCRLPGSSGHGILQASILEWVQGFIKLGPGILRNAQDYLAICEIRIILGIILRHYSFFSFSFSFTVLVEGDHLICGISTDWMPKQTGEFHSLWLS